MSKILFYRNDHSANINRKLADGYGGVGYYRIVQPAKYLKGHEVDIVGMSLTKKGESRDKRWARVFKDYDIFWCSYFYDAEEASSMFYHRDKFKKKVVVDLDDNYLDILPTHLLYDVMKPTKRNRAITSTILSFADAITVSTEPLKQKIAEHLKKVHNLEKKIFVVPNMNEISDWDFESTGKDPNKIVIGYAGSNSHYDDLQMVLPHIAKIMEKYPQVYFESIGAVAPADIHLFNIFNKSTRDRCDFLPSTSTFKEYTEYLASMKWDIGICPLVDSAFTRSKSHIKWMEYAMYKIPTIASRVYPYSFPCFGRDTVIHEKTGLLVKPSEWVGALEDLILNKNKRISLGQNAYEFVKDGWQYSQGFSDVLDEIVKSLQ